MPAKAHVRTLLFDSVLFNSVLFDFGELVNISDASWRNYANDRILELKLLTQRVLNNRILKRAELLANKSLG